MIAKSIINKNQFLILKLFKSERTNFDIIALIFCELYFRKNIDRFIEYFAMPLLFIFNKKRLEKLSVGIGQIQIKHWNSLSNNQSPISAKAYSRYFSVNENYDLLKTLIEENLNNHYLESQLIAFHTGETRKYHFSLFRELKIEIKMHFKKYKNNNINFES